MKLPVPYQILVLVGMLLLIALSTGFVFAGKLISFANKLAFANVETHKCIDSWALQSKPLEAVIDRRIEHKDANFEQARIYRDKEMRDLILNSNREISGLKSEMREGFKSLQEKFDSVKSTSDIQGVQIINLHDNERRLEQMVNEMGRARSSHD